MIAEFRNTAGNFALLFLKLISEALFEAGEQLVSNHLFLLVHLCPQSLLHLVLIDFVQAHFLFKPIESTTAALGEGFRRWGMSFHLLARVGRPIVVGKEDRVGQGCALLVFPRIHQK